MKQNTMSNRLIDAEVDRAEQAVFNTKCANAKAAGQKLLARIRPSSKYFGQGDEGRLFSVAITAPEEYCVKGGPGGRYRLSDVDLFAVFDSEDPTQITFER